MDRKEMIMAAKKYDFFFLKLKWNQEQEIIRKPKNNRQNELKPCGKIIFQSKKQASATADSLEKRTRQKIKNIYFCKRCNGWHFSRMGKQDFKGE